MDDYEMIERKLRDGCHEGNRHNCIRDVSRLAGGCFASGRIGADEIAGLRGLAMGLAGGGREFEREWDRGVEFGKSQPAERTDAPDESQPDRPLDWDEPLVLAEAGARRLAGRDWAGEEEVGPPEDWDGAADLREYLEGLFRADEHVGFVTDAAERDGKWTPASRGVCYMTAGEMCKALRKGAVEDAVGDYNPLAGAWMRFNPLDGEGVSDANVTDLRYALVECDEDSVGRQVALIKSLRLPCRFIVHSGGHSAHAIVKVDAGTDREEYRRRVEFLYRTCREKGLKADRTGNPSRLSRMPGATRNGRPQYIIARECGAASWAEWVDWLEEQADDLPPIQDAAGLVRRVADGSLPLRPELVSGVLREGHKMRLTGPSKAGKSFALLELAVCLTEGGSWLGRFPCPNPGNVLYVNLELDEASCAHRLAEIYAAMGVRPRHAANLHVWQLRGRATGLDRLAPILIRRCRDMHLKAAIVDPIYKVLTGDENAAAEMARFCNLFDRIAVECGCAVIDCHHHSKGAQGGKRSMDRASGSGVFARDPDALLDMIQLDAENARAQAQRNDEQAALWRVANAACPRQADGFAPDASPDELFRELERLGHADEARAARLPAVGRWKGATAWRIEPTLREFPAFAAADVWFQYPVHRADAGGLLADCRPADEGGYARGNPNPKGTSSGGPAAATLVKNILAEWFQDPGRVAVTYADLAEEVSRRNPNAGVCTRTFNNALKNSTKYHVVEKTIYRGGKQK